MTKQLLSPNYPLSYETGTEIGWSFQREDPTLVFVVEVIEFEVMIKKGNINLKTLQVSASHFLFQTPCISLVFIFCFWVPDSFCITFKTNPKYDFLVFRPGLTSCPIGPVDHLETWSGTRDPGNYSVFDVDQLSIDLVSKRLWYSWRGFSIRVSLAEKGKNIFFPNYMILHERESHI